MSRGKHDGTLIIPIFLPNQGCPHRCVYCRQEEVTGVESRVPSPSEISAILSMAVRSPRFASGSNREIAFYGGTFTGLPLDTMNTLLSTAFPWVEDGSFHGIRVSTRPDALDEERLSLMVRHGVATVELGVQSLDDEVLRQTRRGYLSGEVEKSVALLKQFGFRIGIQLMPGLPGDSRSRFLGTVRGAVELEPDLVRLYPTVVFKHTVLEEWYRLGIYKPLSLEDAVDLCADACVSFESKGIRVIRVGLPAPGGPAAEGCIIAGPWHPAFGFMVRSAVYHRQITDLLGGTHRAVRIRVNPRDICLVLGHGKKGVESLARRTGGTVPEIVQDHTVPRQKPRVEFM